MSTALLILVCTFVKLHIGCSALQEVAGGSGESIMGAFNTLQWLQESIMGALWQALHPSPFGKLSPILLHLCVQFSIQTINFSEEQIILSSQVDWAKYW